MSSIKASIPLYVNMYPIKQLISTFLEEKTKKKKKKEIIKILNYEENTKWVVPYIKKLKHIKRIK